jgi:hypothetical protein
VIEAARAALAEHTHFRGRAACFELSVYEDSLVIEGAAPSFYLKQLLQTVLKKVDGVQRVCNHVAVVSPRGLSSVPRHGPAPAAPARRSIEPCPPQAA